MMDNYYDRPLIIGNPQPKCPNANNPFGHHPECPCRQTPFEDPDIAREEYLAREEARFEAELDRQMGSDW